MKLDFCMGWVSVDGDSMSLRGREEKQLEAWLVKELVEASTVSYRSKRRFLQGASRRNFEGIGACRG